MPIRPSSWRRGSNPSLGALLAGFDVKTRRLVHRGERLDTFGHGVEDHMRTGDKGGKVLVIAGHDHSDKSGVPQRTGKLLGGKRGNGDRVFGENEPSHSSTLDEFTVSVEVQAKFFFVVDALR